MVIDRKSLGFRMIFINPTSWKNYRFQETFLCIRIANIATAAR